MFIYYRMDVDELMHVIEKLGLTKSELAKLVQVTPRAVNLWCSGDREIPGPVEAYIKLLVSLPKALFTKELARIREYAVSYEGMYAVNYSGLAGCGTSILVLMDGCVFGHDGGVIYDGTYEPNCNDPNRMDLKLQLTVPPGVSLVQGVPAQPAEYTFPIEITVPARGKVNLNVATPYGGVPCRLSYLRPLPSRLVP